METHFRFLLVCADDEHRITVKKFKTEQEAREKMISELKETLFKEGYTEEMFKEQCELGYPDDFNVGERWAWVSIAHFGWVDWEIFDLKEVKEG